jgi:hypothetical protein
MGSLKRDRFCPPLSIPFSMSFIPPGETIIERKICSLSGQEFFVTDKDLVFYEKISPIFGGKKYSIPIPTLCPEERQRRRLSFRNARNVYMRPCSGTGKMIFSAYDVHAKNPVYENDFYYSDQWDPKAYHTQFDFSQTF